MIALLGYAGLIPFIALPLSSMVFDLLPPAQAMLIFQFYSCLILGFMAGVLWPVLYQTPQQNPRALWAVSFPVIAILALTFTPAISVLILAALFMLLRGYEFWSGLNSQYDTAYQRLRNHLTFVVVLCHLGFYISYG